MLRYFLNVEKPEKSNAKESPKILLTQKINLNIICNNTNVEGGKEIKILMCHV
jgi:hypothetical protein